MIEILREFGWALNLAFLTPALGLIWALYRAAMKAKESQIEALQQQLEVERASSVGNVAERLRAYREFNSLWVVEEIKSWHDASVQQLGRLRDRLTEETAPDQEARIREEIAVRAELLSRLLGSSKGPMGWEPASIQTLAGTWSIVGRDPGEDGAAYLGTLEIGERDGRAAITWRSGLSTHRDRGLGLVLGTCLAVTFRDGIALYEVFGAAVMRGRWFVASRPAFGLEECRKLDREPNRAIGLAGSAGSSSPHR